MGPALRRLFPYVLRYRRRFLFGLGCTLATTAISLAAPWILKHAVDDLTAEVTRGKLAFYAGLLLAAAVVGGLFRYLMRRVIVGISREVEYNLRNDFFAALERFALVDFQTRRTGDLVSRATNDLNAVRMLVGPAVMYAANTVVLFVAAVFLMASISGRLTLVAMAPLPAVSIAVRWFGAAIHHRFERIQAQLSELSAIAQEALAGVRVVRAYVQEGAELEKFRLANDEYVVRNRRLIRLQGTFFPCLSLLLGCGMLLILWLGSREVIYGRITLGEFVAFNSYLTMLSWPMIAFGWVTNMGQRGLASWQRMLEVLDHTPAVRDEQPRPAPPPGPAWRGEIEIRDLRFSHDGRVVLDGVSCHVRAGETLAVVGGTGSGKSTLISLLPRLYDPPPGTVFIDGRDVRTIPLEVLRGLIGFVSQESFLFSDTLAENIAFGLEETGPDDRRAAVERAGALARLDKDVSGFPAGYDTVVGERGITLSGGQKQRTALARALAVDPRILILDDALSSVDTFTEEEILGRLRGVLGDRTTIIVSHRVSTVRGADQILVLDAGRIAERGTHDELVALGGSYAELHRRQMLEEELEAS